MRLAFSHCFQGRNSCIRELGINHRNLTGPLLLTNAPLAQSNKTGHPTLAYLFVCPSALSPHTRLYLFLRAAIIRFLPSFCVIPIIAYILAIICGLQLSHHSIQLDPQPCTSSLVTLTLVSRGRYSLVIHTPWLIQTMSMPPLFRTGRLTLRRFYHQSLTQMRRRISTQALLQRQKMLAPLTAALLRGWSSWDHGAAPSQALAGSTVRASHLQSGFID